MTYKINYALHDNGICFGCEQEIRAGDLQIRCEQVYHFACLFENFHDELWQKSNIAIGLDNGLENSFSDRNFPTVTLEEFDNNPGNYDLAINYEDLEKVREQFALAYEHKTSYFIPSVSKKSLVKCCVRDKSHSAFKENLELQFQGYTFHPVCLSKAAKVNVDADEIKGYNLLTDDEKEFLNELFQKDAEILSFPQAQTLKYGCSEFCGFCSKCVDRFKIRYQTKAYCCKCFGEMGKVNLDGNEFGNYTSLNKANQKKLDDHFKKSEDFDIPEIQKVVQEDYCDSDECCMAYGRPSKFPWPYTIIMQHKIQIWFQGKIFHPKCFKSSGITDLNIDDFANYEECNEKEKKFIDAIFLRQDDETESDETEEDESESGINGSSLTVSDETEEDENDEPPAKKRKVSENSNPSESDFDDNDGDPLLNVTPDELYRDHSERDFDYDEQNSLMDVTVDGTNPDINDDIFNDEDHRQSSVYSPPEGELVNREDSPSTKRKTSENVNSDIRLTDSNQNEDIFNVNRNGDTLETQEGEHVNDSVNDENMSPNGTDNVRHIKNSNVKNNSNNENEKELPQFVGTQNVAETPNKEKLQNTSTISKKFIPSYYELASESESDDDDINVPDLPEFENTTQSSSIEGQSHDLIASILILFMAVFSAISFWLFSFN